MIAQKARVHFFVSFVGSCCRPVSSHTLLGSSCIQSRCQLARDLEVTQPVLSGCAGAADTTTAPLHFRSDAHMYPVAAVLNRHLKVSPLV